MFLHTIRWDERKRLNFRSDLSWPHKRDRWQVLCEFIPTLLKVGNDGSVPRSGVNNNLITKKAHPLQWEDGVHGTGQPHSRWRPRVESSPAVLIRSGAEQSGDGAADSAGWRPLARGCRLTESAECHMLHSGAGDIKPGPYDNQGRD